MVDSLEKKDVNKEIIDDAEDIKIDKKNNLLSIGGKIAKFKVSIHGYYKIKNKV